METIVVNVKGINFAIHNKQEHIQSYWMRGSFYEAQNNGLLSFLKRNNYSGKCLDIGACIGNHSLYFHHILGCDVISFEPTKSSFNHLIKNCELNNSNIKCYNIALGNLKRKVSMESMSKGKLNVGMMQVISGNDVEMDLLDNIVSGQFSFIKIDVENFNIPLLIGAEKTLKYQNKCSVFIECENKSILTETDFLMGKFGYIRNLNIKLNYTPTYLWTKSE